MAADETSIESVWSKAEGMFAPGQLERLRDLGLDMLEGRREGPYLYDDSGRRYLDAFSAAGTFNLGRRKPELVEALRQSMRETDIGNFPMISDEKSQLAQALAEFVPGPLECSLFAVMRGEAMDAACKVARGFTRRPEFLAVDGGWHGETGFALGLSERADRACYGPLDPETHTLPFGDLAAAESLITEKTAAVFLELLQAENHCRAAPPEYVRGLGDLCRARGALLVFDETQTGFGRTGAKFLCETYGVYPDMLLLGEALGGGVFPIAVTLLTQRVNEFLNAHPLIHLSTFGGADLGCRVALKALELYGAEEPWRNAATMGEYLTAAINKLREMPDSPIRGVTGKGLLLALHLDDAETAEAFCRHARECGLIAVPGKVARHTVLLRPSLLITTEQADEIAEALRGAAGRIASGK